MWLEFPWQMPKKCNSVSKMVQVKHRELWVKTATLYSHRQVEKNGNNILNTICARFWIFKEYSLVAWIVTNLPAKQETQVWSLGRKDPLEKRIATHSSILAWRIPWTEEPAGLQSTGSKRVGHDWATKHEHTVSFKFGSLKIYLLWTFKMFLYLFLIVEYEANFSLWLFLLII